MNSKKLKEILSIFSDLEIYIKNPDGSFRKLDGVDMNGVKEDDGSVHLYNGEGEIGKKRVFVLV